MKPIEVFVSYNRHDKADRSLAYDLRDLFSGPGIGFKVRLLEDEVKYKGSISSYRQELVQGAHVILILSDSYFENDGSMIELSLLGEQEDFAGRIHPIVQDNTPLSDVEASLDQRLKWESRKDAINAKFKEIKDFSNTESAIEQLNALEHIRKSVIRLMAKLNDMMLPSIAEHRQERFVRVVDAIRIQQKTVDRQEKTHQGKPSLSPNTIYRCDRMPQWYGVNDELQEGRKARRFFLLPGPELEEHDAFAERIKLELLEDGYQCHLGDTSPWDAVWYTQPGSLKSDVNQLLTEIVKALGIQPNKRNPLREQNFMELLRETKARASERVQDPFFFQIKVSDSCVVVPHIPDVMKAVCEWIARPAEKDEPISETIVVWSVVQTPYGPPVQTVQAAIDALKESAPEIVHLPALQPLDRDMLRQWFIQNTPRLEAEIREAYLNFLFSAATLITMREAHKHLATFIDEYPNPQIPPRP